MNPFRRRPQRRDFAGPHFLDPNRIPSNWDDASRGPAVNATSAMRQSAVWASVQLLTNAVATLPVDSFRRREGFPDPVIPTPPVLVRPHPVVSIVDFLTQGMMSLLLRGNFYAAVVARDPVGFPSALLPLNPDRVRVTADPDGGDPLYDVGGARVPASDILHIKGLTQPGDLVGLSVIDAARQNIALALSAEAFGARFFSEGTNPTGVLSTDEDLSGEDMELLRQSWEAAHGAGSRRPAVLTSGIRWAPISVPPEQAQFLETRSFQVSDIARLFGVPPHLIGDVNRSSSWGTGIEEQNLGFLQYSLRPWLVRWEGALSSLLPRPQFVKFNVDALLRGRTADQYAAFQTALAAGFLTLDEVRELIERRPLPPPPPPPTPIPPLPTEEPQDGP